MSNRLAAIGLDPHFFATHALRCTKATLIYGRTGNLRAVELLLGHTKIASTVSYLEIYVDDGLAIAEQVELQGQSRIGLAPPSASHSCHNRTFAGSSRGALAAAPPISQCLWRSMRAE